MKYDITRFSSSLIISTGIFQIIVPLFPMPVIYEFYRQFHTIGKNKFYRFKNYQSYLVKDIFVRSLKLAISIFMSYSVLFLVCYLVKGDKLTNVIEREILLDLLGREFYLNHHFLYFYLEGMIRFFIIPFIYAFFGQGVVLLAKSAKFAMAIPSFYYYGLTVLGFALRFVIGNRFIYITPTTIMASGDYLKINTLALFIVHLIPLIIGYAIIAYRSKYVEI